MKLWLDDDERGYRNPPDRSWTWCKSVNEAIKAILDSDSFTDADLDHDLGPYSHDGGDGIKLIDWMESTGNWPTRSITIHSANPEGVKNMMRVIDKCEVFERSYFSNRRTRSLDTADKTC